MSRRPDFPAHHRLPLADLDQPPSARAGLPFGCYRAGRYSAAGPPRQAVCLPGEEVGRAGRRRDPSGARLSVCGRHLPASSAARVFAGLEQRKWRRPPQRLGSLPNGKKYSCYSRSGRRVIMLRKRMILAAALVSLIGGAVAAAPGSASDEPHRHERVEGLVFVQTNKPLGNTIRVYQRGDGGELSLAGEFETGGLGGSTLNPPVDPLASQSSLVYRDGLLFAVNAGSNTVTLFRVDGSELERLQVIWSGGLLPVSLDVRDDLVYVLNAGGEGVVQGYRLDDDELEPIRGAQRSLGLDNPNPPPFGDAPAQVGIDPEGEVVLVSTKSHNIIDAFRIERGGRLSEEPVSNPAEGMPFGFTFDHRGGLMVTLAATNAVIRYRLDEENGKLTAVGPAVPNGQMASCWIQRVGDYYYVANAGSSTLSSYRIDEDGQVVLVAAVAAKGDGGTIDMTTSGGFLYVQNGAAGTVQGFDVLDDGSLKLVNTTTGLPQATNNGGILNGMEGIAATP
ncbi:hypothetical protein C6W10_33890 [Plantactinospora sp. BB1]|nr:hypothetical protein C6W10_33890 [Plantactinospora sp. BB1]